MFLIANTSCVSFVLIPITLFPLQWRCDDVRAVYCVVYVLDSTESVDPEDWFQSADRLLARRVPHTENILYCIFSNLHTIPPLAYALSDWQARNFKSAFAGRK